MSGKFIVIVGPSASGKTMLVKALLERLPNSARLITTTTRAPRPGEQNGIDYYFLSRKEFEARIADNEFFEYADVYGNWYGSSQKVLSSFVDEYDYVFAIIDVQGAKTLKKKLPGCVRIFVKPNSIDEIKNRLQTDRADMPEKELEERLLKVEQELALASTFEAIIQNKEGKFKETVDSCVELLSRI